MMTDIEALKKRVLLTRDPEAARELYRLAGREEDWESAQIGCKVLAEIGREEWIDPETNWFRAGAPVVTAAESTLRLKHREYLAEARIQRRASVRGTVLRGKTGHGLCFEVRFEDGTTGWFEPEELRIADKPR